MRTNNLTSKINDKIEHTQEVMVQNIEHILNNIEIIEAIKPRTQALASDAQVYAIDARKLKNAFRWRNFLLKAFLVSAAIVSIYALGALYLGVSTPRILFNSAILGTCGFAITSIALKLKKLFSLSIFEPYSSPQSQTSSFYSSLFKPAALLFALRKTNSQEPAAKNTVTVEKIIKPSI